MKILRLSVLFLALLGAVVAPSPARAQGEVSFDFFYDSLAPYGDWIEVGDYGLCWTPTNVDRDWSPYADGYFAFTDGGWTWVSYEDFGGIVYHYGRWIHLYDGRWCWVPDYEWAPSWVSWRHGHDYIGWAPLPPEARWRRDVGFSIWVDDAYDIGPGCYHFCYPRDFGAPVLRAVIINPEENVTIIHQTVNITNITYNTSYAGGPVVYVGGPSYEEVNRAASRPIPALKLVRNENFDPAHWREQRGKGGRLSFNAQTVGNQLIVAAPVVAPPRDPSAFRARVKTVVAADKVSKGWGLVKNPDVQKELRQEFRRQSKGLTPETAPAHAVAAEDFKAVPVKADPHATPVTTADRHEKPGKGQRPESIVVQPNNVPPNAPTGGNPLLKPFNGGPGSEPPKSKSQNAPTATFTPNPPGPGEPVVPGSKHPRSVDTTAQDRITQQKQAEMANQQRQAEIAAQKQKQISAQQEAGKMQAEESRRHEFEKQQQFQQQLQIQQQRSVDTRKAQEAEREHEKQQAEAQVHSNKPPPSQPQPANKNHPKDSKDSKDKDKDKDKNGN